jgi:hypothetical protein
LAKSSGKRAREGPFILRPSFSWAHRLLQWSMSRRHPVTPTLAPFPFRAPAPAVAAWIDAAAEDPWTGGMANQQVLIAAIEEVARQGDLASLEEFLSRRGIQALRLSSHHFACALQAASEHGHTAIIRRLAQDWLVPPTDIEPWSWTKASEVALNTASRTGQAACVGALLAYTTALTDTALSQASIMGHDQVVSLLISHASPAGLSAGLLLASHNGHARCVELLLPCVPAQDMGCEPLKKAAEQNHQVCIELLLPHTQLDDLVREWLLLDPWTPMCTAIESLAPHWSPEQREQLLAHCGTHLLPLLNDLKSQWEREQVRATLETHLASPATTSGSRPPRL